VGSVNALTRMLLLLASGAKGFASTKGPVDASTSIDELLLRAETDNSAYEKQHSELLATWKQVREGGEESVGLESEPYFKFIDTSGLKPTPKSRRLEEDPLADGYPIYMDGWNATYVPREVIDGFASQMVFSFPLEQSATIGIDGTSARVPLQVLLQGGYARKVDTTGEEESGLANVVWMQNVESILTDKATVFWASKEHTVQSNGKGWDETSLDQTVQYRRSPAGRAAQTVLNRGALVPVGPMAGTWIPGQRITTLRDITEGISGSTGWAYEIVDGSMDLGHLEQVREYAVLEDGEADVEEKLASADYTALSAEATEMAQPGAGRTGVKSEQLCLHIEEAEGLTLHAEEGYFELPLNKNLVALRGQVSASPMRVFGVLTGTLVATLSPSGKELLLYLTFSSQSYVPFSAGAKLPPPALYLGPVDGKAASATAYPVPATDGRSTKHIHGPSKFRWQTYKVLQKIPVDYTRFWKPHEEICPPERVDTLNTIFTNGSAWLAKHERGLKAANELLYYLAVGGVLFLNVNCAGNYLRGIPNGGNGYEQLEMTVFGHFIFEIPWWIVPEMTTQSWWEDGVTPSTTGDVLREKNEKSHDDAVKQAVG